MAGLVFLRTANLEKVIEFYKKLGMNTWIQQPDIEILNHGNFLVGFHASSEIDNDSLLTFFYETKEEVDDMYAQFENIALTKPKMNDKYRIYNFFAKDPEGRKIEFQCFMHEINQVKIEWLD